MFTMIPDSSAMAIWAMIAACILPILFAITAKILAGFSISDNANPREVMAKATGLAARVDAVQKNSFESLPMFLAAVITALLFFVPMMAIVQLSWLYVSLRVVYGLTYMFNWSVVRSVIWFLSMLCIFMLFYLTAQLAI